MEEQKVTCRDVAYKALKLIGHIDEKGNIDDSKEGRYLSVCPEYIEILEKLAADRMKIELSDELKDIESELQIEKSVALKVLPTGLAMYFSLMDRDSELYNHFKECFYNDSLKSLKPDETPIFECYIKKNDPMFSSGSLN